jgi:hypothetical protein
MTADGRVPERRIDRGVTDIAYEGSADVLSVLSSSDFVNRYSTDAITIKDAKARDRCIIFAQTTGCIRKETNHITLCIRPSLTKKRKQSVREHAVHRLLWNKHKTNI